MLLDVYSNYSNMDDTLSCQYGGGSQYSRHRNQGRRGHAGLVALAMPLDPMSGLVLSRNPFSQQLTTSSCTEGGGKEKNSTRHTPYFVFTYEVRLHNALPFHLALT